MSSAAHSGQRCCPDAARALILAIQFAFSVAAAIGARALLHRAVRGRTAAPLSTASSGGTRGLESGSR